jgi:hypothetical protein
MPGSSGTSPKPVFWAMPTHPDHTSAAAGRARSSSGQDRMVLPRSRTAPDQRAGENSFDDVTGVVDPSERVHRSDLGADRRAGQG